LKSEGLKWTLAKTESWTLFISFSFFLEKTGPVIFFAVAFNAPYCYPIFDPYFDKFSEKNQKKAKKQWKPPKMHFWYICIVLAFSTLSQKNLNFQRYLERVQLLTRKFYDHWFSLLSWRWYCSLSKIQKNKKNQNLQKKRKRKVKEKLRD